MAMSNMALIYLFLFWWRAPDKSFIWDSASWLYAILWQGSKTLLTSTLYSVFDWHVVVLTAVLNKASALTKELNFFLKFCPAVILRMTTLTRSSYNVPGVIASGFIAKWKSTYMNLKTFYLFIHGSNFDFNKWNIVTSFYRFFKKNFMYYSIE